MGDFLTDITSTVLAKGLDAAGVRHRVIADNLANVETPGFKRSEVTFETDLKTALEAGNDRSVSEQISNLQPVIEEDTTSPTRPDGNNVSVDKEMGEMAKNSLQYETLVQLMNLKAAMLRSAIFEGKR